MRDKLEVLSSSIKCSPFIGLGGCSLVQFGTDSRISRQSPSRTLRRSARRPLSRQFAVFQRTLPVVECPRVNSATMLGLVLNLRLWKLLVSAICFSIFTLLLRENKFLITILTSSFVSMESAKYICYVCHSMGKSLGPNKTCDPFNE